MVLELQEEEDGKFHRGHAPSLSRVGRVAQKLSLETLTSDGIMKRSSGRRRRRRPQMLLPWESRPTGDIAMVM